MVGKQEKRGAYLMMNCLQCGKKIEGRKDTKAKTFCSHECYSRSLIKLHIRKCKKCGTPFVLKNIAYERRGAGKYCSTACSKYATKKHYLNERFFQTIDSEKKAYWLGFIFADGNNSTDELSIELAEVDANHLESLKKDLEATQRVSFRARISFHKQRRYASIRFSSRAMCKDLSAIGCIPNKSKVVNYPVIASELNRHFIRGFFDGDGCVSLNKTCNSAVWSIYSASKDMMYKIREIMESELNEPISLHIRKNNGGYSLSIAKRSLLSKVHQYLYENASVFLHRKKGKLDQLFEQIETTRCAKIAAKTCEFLIQHR